MAKNRGLSESIMKDIESRLIDWDDTSSSLDPWTEIIENSDSDAYGWEVAESGDQKYNRFKRRVKKQFFEGEWFDDFLNSYSKLEKMQTKSQTPPPFSKKSLILPIKSNSALYHLHIDNQQYGPYSINQLKNWLDTGQVLPDTLAWCEGMENWEPLKTLTHFSSLITSTAPPPLPKII